MAMDNDHISVVQRRAARRRGLLSRQPVKYPKRTWPICWLDDFFGDTFGMIFLGWFLGVKHYSYHAHICQDTSIISNQLQSLTPDRQFQQHLNIIALALSSFHLKSSPKRHRKMVETNLETNSRCSSDWVCHSHFFFCCHCSHDLTDWQPQILPGNWWLQRQRLQRR